MGELYRTEGRGRPYTRITETVGDTPSVRLNRIAPSHVTMYVKVESFNPLASVKDRLALNIIEAAEREGRLQPGQTVVEATSGNTGHPKDQIERSFLSLPLPNQRPSPKSLTRQPKF